MTDKVLRLQNWKSCLKRVITKWVTSDLSRGCFNEYDAVVFCFVHIFPVNVRAHRSLAAEVETTGQSSRNDADLTKL